jgi:hypothetical protein
MKSFAQSSMHMNAFETRSEAFQKENVLEDEG